MKKFIALILSLLMLTFGASAMSLQGVDIYHGSYHVNFKALKSSGHGNFVYIKATEGERTPDTSYSENARGARSVNIPYGAYHYFHPYSTASAIRQADFFWRTIKGTGYQLIPSVDVESYDGQNRSSDIRTMLRAFITEFQRLSGQKPMIYTYTDYAENVIGYHYTDCKLWIADYRGHTDVLPGWGNNYSIWQYSGDRARVRGVDNPCDLDLAVDKSIFMIAHTKPVKSMYPYVAKVRSATIKFRTVRTSPSWYSHKVGTVRTGDKYEIMGPVRSGWVQIGLCNKPAGWVSASIF